MTEPMSFYALSGPDNDTYMCGSCDVLHHDEVPGIPHCIGCGYKTDPFFINPHYRMKKTIYDFSYTYDGYPIASLKLRELCLRHDITGAFFTPLPGDPHNFLFRSDEVVPFDAERAGSRFEDFCTTSGRYGSVVGAYPPFLKSLPKRDVAESDLHFGSGNELSPELIVSGRFKALCEAEKLRGPYFEMVSVGAAA